jgi:hypothetical protein
VGSMLGTVCTVGSMTTPDEGSEALANWMVETTTTAGSNMPRTRRDTASPSMGTATLLAVAARDQSVMQAHTDRPGMKWS